MRLVKPKPRYKEADIMCCGLCNYYRVIKLPGIGRTKICQLTDREVDPKDCDCTEFSPVTVETMEKEVD
jgi:hypothetical protein